MMGGIQRSTAAAAVIASLAAGAAPALAQTTAPVPPAAATRCPASVSMVIPDRGDRGATIGVSTYGHSGKATGIVRLYAGEWAYDVPFVDQFVPQRFAEGNPQTQALVVKFAKPAHVDAAVLLTLEGAPCQLADPWIAPTRDMVEDLGVAQEREPWRTAARKAKPVDAPDPVALAPAKCSKDEFYSYPARVSDIAPFGRELQDRFRGHSAIVFLDVNQEGKPDATMYLPTHDKAVDDGLIERFAATKWKPAYLRCAAVPIAVPIAFTGQGTVGTFKTPHTPWDNVTGR